MHLPQTAKPECGTRRWGGGASAPSSLAAIAQKFKDRKSRGLGEAIPNAPGLPECQPHTGHFPTHNVRRLWALHDEGIWNIACVLSGKILGTAVEAKDLRKWWFAARAHKWSPVEVGSS